MAHDGGRFMQGFHVQRISQKDRPRRNPLPQNTGLRCPVVPRNAEYGPSRRFSHYGVNRPFAGLLAHERYRLVRPGIAA